MFKWQLTSVISTWQIEMGWPRDIHWLARDLGWAGGSHCVSFGQELEYAVGAYVGSVVGGAAPTDVPI